ncbi:MAG: WXG100 family type VII secretion target [Chloroflexi bacterium]|nr:WXG100 family type VII secretion target [Chloroflexota bacterium]
MPDVRMNYSSMEAMQKAFHHAHSQIEDTMREMEKIAKTMEDGAMLGMAGDTFREAIRTKLMKRMKVLAEKMRELEGDIHGAVIATRDGVSTAQSRFK